MTTLAKVLDDELAAQGVDTAHLDAGDFEYATVAIRSFVSRLKTRRTWEEHLGALAGHSEVLALTGWSKQALSQAVRDHRALRLEATSGHAYLLAAFDDQTPARPLPGIKEALEPWSAADPRGWATASWFMTPQPELGGKRPRDALADGMRDQVAILARQAAARVVV